MKIEKNDMVMVYDGGGSVAVPLAIYKYSRPLHDGSRIHDLGEGA